MAIKRPLAIYGAQVAQLTEGDSLDLGVISADADIYVSTTGDDTTGDGSIGNPYLTIFRAAEHVSALVPGQNVITVHLLAGSHDVDETIAFTFQYGSNIEWVGDAEDVATPTISAIDASATTGSAPYTGLEWIEFDLDLAAADPDPVVGNFVYLEACAGGSNPGGLNGLAEVMAVASGVATCRLWRRVGTTELPSGAVTVASAKLIRTVLNFTADDHGMNIQGPYDMGNWSGIVFKGNDDAVASSKRAVRLFTGAGLRSASGFTAGVNIDGLHVYQWNTGYEIIGSGASVYALEGSVSKCTARGFRVDNGASVRFTGGVVHGCGTIAVNCSSGADCEFSTTNIHSVTNPVSADRGSVGVSNCLIEFDQGGQTAITAVNGAFVRADGATLTGFATNYAPPADTYDDGAYIHVAATWAFGTNGTQRTRVESTGVVAEDSVLQPAKIIYGFGSGANYTVTNTSAEVNEGTDSAIVIDEAGEYTLRGSVTLRYSGATFGTSEVITLKLRRTNNTATDVADSSVALVAFQLTTFSGSMTVSVREAPYDTSNTDDRIALFIDVSAGPSAGSLLVTESSIVAERIS